MRSVLPATLFAVILAGGVWPLIEPFVPRPDVPTSAQQLRTDHAELQCFAQGVLQKTAPGTTIRVELPDGFRDGELVNHRLRYIITNRHVVLQGSADYVASWRAPEPKGRVLWRGCEGVLVQQ
jgi:hypothetical protein